MADLLICDNVSKAFGKMMAVNAVSFRVAEHQIFGIAGPNGAGKTTLFNTISGIPFRSDSGTIVFRGQPIQGMLPHAIAHLGVARTFQRETVFHSLTVLENVIIGAQYGQKTLASGDLRERAHDALRLVGLEHRSNDSSRNLPLFEKKRLMLASALVTNPTLLLLDEPAAGLNQVEIRKTIELVQAIHARGVTIVLIEHVLPLLLELSQHIMVLNMGEKLLEGDPRAVVRDARVVEAYLGKRGGHEFAAS
jgi:branched-chain amino acid transport system ATP-binding protein